MRLHRAPARPASGNITEMVGWKTRCGLACVAVAFVASGMLFIPRLGIETDEASITSCIYPRAEPRYAWTFGANVLPIMMHSYVGALKSWIFSLLFLVTPPRPISLRLPTLLIAATTLWLFFALLDRVAGRRAAWIGTLLLATDPIYLLINATDFGFVTLQFLFKLAALLLLLRFHRNGSRLALAAAFFLFGLALWDKAVFSWVLFGLAVAALVVIPRELWRHFTRANVAVAASALLVGALPLVAYNVARPLETLRANAKLEHVEVSIKGLILKRTVDGSGLFGFMTGVESGPRPGEARHWYQSLSVSASEGTGHPHQNLIIAALLASMAALPLLWRTPARKPILFGAITCAVTWVAMALTAGAGAAVHHVILLWPFHLLAIAAALSRVPLAPCAAVAALLCASNVAVTNQYYADLISNGPAIHWTDAMDPLQAYLDGLHAPKIYAADWGFMETMTLLSEGRLPMYYADLSSGESIGGMIGDPANVFVAFTPPFGFHLNEPAAIENVAAREKFVREQIATIYDRNGRPTFDVFRFRKLHL